MLPIWNTFPKMSLSYLDFNKKFKNTIYSKHCNNENLYLVKYPIITFSVGSRFISGFNWKNIQFRINTNIEYSL